MNISLLLLALNFFCNSLNLNKKPLTHKQPSKTITSIVSFAKDYLPLALLVSLTIAYLKFVHYLVKKSSYKLTLQDFLRLFSAVSTAWISPIADYSSRFLFVLPTYFYNNNFIQPFNSYTYFYQPLYIPSYTCLPMTSF